MGSHLIYYIYPDGTTGFINIGSRTNDKAIFTKYIALAISKDVINKTTPSLSSPIDHTAFYFRDLFDRAERVVEHGYIYFPTQEEKKTPTVKKTEADIILEMLD